VGRHHPPRSVSVLLVRAPRFRRERRYSSRVSRTSRYGVASVDFPEAWMGCLAGGEVAAPSQLLRLRRRPRRRPRPGDGGREGLRPSNRPPPSAVKRDMTSYAGWEFLIISHLRGPRGLAGAFALLTHTPAVGPGRRGIGPDSSPFPAWWGEWRPVCRQNLFCRPSGSPPTPPSGPRAAPWCRRHCSVRANGSRKSRSGNLGRAVNNPRRSAGAPALRSRNRPLRAYV
jgi:hypothetical protein